VLERIVGIENESGFAVYEGSTGDDRSDFFRIGEGLEGTIENGADDAGLLPSFAFSKGAAGGEASDFGAGSGATRRAVISLAGTEDEVLGVGGDAGSGGSEAFDVIDFFAVCSGDSLDFECVADG